MYSRGNTGSKVVKKKQTNDEAGRTVGERKRRNPAVEVGVERNYSSMLS